VQAIHPDLSAAIDMTDFSKVCKGTG